jgi:iron complex outermembrane receptor protein
MNTSPSHMRRELRRALALLSLPSLLSLSAAAQSTSTSGADAQDDKTVKLEKYTVTGSYIPAALDETNASPVFTVTAKDIEASGLKTNVLDILRKSVPQIIGGNNIGIENANTAGNFTNGGSTVALRNTTTLVLIDGMRVVVNPVAGTGGGSFVDLNIVPVSAVERIEVLTDGASAIYGSDAVSGVINIILKKDYRGAEVGGYYGFAKSDKTGASYRVRSARVVGGAGSDKTSMTFSAEWTHNDPLYERDFNYTSPVFLTSSYPGVVNDANGNFYKLAPGLAAAGVYVLTPSAQVPLGFDLSGRPTFSGELDKRIASVAMEHRFTDDLKGNVTMLYAHTFNQYNLNPQPIVFRINSNAGNTGLPGIPITDVRAQVRNRFVDNGNRVYINDTNTIRASGSLSGKISNDWGWTVDALYNHAWQDSIATNQILDSALQAGIASGLINLTAIKQDPAKVAQAGIFGDSLAINTGKLIAYNARVNGRLFDLPAGSVYTALGTGYRLEALAVRADLNSVLNPATGTSAWNNGVSLNLFNAKRTVQDMFGEVKIPLTSAQNSIPGFYTSDLDIAVRHEIYSNNAGKPTVPKVSLRWLPFNEEFLIRSTYSKSFAAPTLFSLYGPQGSGSTPSLSGLTAYNSSGQPIGTFTPIQGNQQGGSNPNLQPSRSKSYTVGVVYSPKAFKGLSLSVDYVSIKETGLVGALAASTTMIQSVEQFGTASPYSPFVRLDNFSQLGGHQVTGPGQLHQNPSNTFVDQFPVNIGRQDQKGLDIAIRYDWTNALGAWSVNSSWNYLKSFIVQTAPDLPAVEYADTNGFGTLPKWHERTTATWQKGAFNAMLANTYIRGVTSAGDGSHIPSFVQFDAQFGVDVAKFMPRFAGLRVTLGVNNIFAKYPPVDANVFNDPPADTGTYGAFGRFWFVDATYKF